MELNCILSCYAIIVYLVQNMWLDILKATDVYLSIVINISYIREKKKFFQLEIKLIILRFLQKHLCYQLCKNSHAHRELFHISNSNVNYKWNNSLIKCNMHVVGNISPNHFLHWYSTVAVGESDVTENDEISEKGN